MDTHNNTTDLSTTHDDGKEQAENKNSKISIDEFNNIEMIVGKVCEVECVPDTDRLLRLVVDLGEAVPRQIVSGIATFFENPQELEGKKCVFVTNLASRTIRGLKSDGMILAAHAKDDSFALMVPEKDIAVGTRIG